MEIPVMVKSIKGWVEDNHNPGMFSKVINGELVQTYVPPDDNPHRMLAQVEAQLSNPVLLLVIPFLFFLMARWWRCALALRAVVQHLRGRPKLPAT
jgi:hypothetical protein